VKSIRANLAPILRALTWTIVAATALYLLLLQPGIRASGVVTAFSIVGRGPGCPLAQAIPAYRARLLQERVIQDIGNASRIVREDGDFLLYRTSAGEFWTPRGMNLPSLLSEQQVKYRAVGGLSLRPGDVVLDCGAHVGVFTRAALEAGARIVVAIEPSPRNLSCLRRTFTTEIASGRALLYPKGVWDREDTLEFRESTTSAEDSLVMRRGEQRGLIRVPVTTIDRLVSELNLDRVDFIKMDIEGAERRALAGAANTLARFRPRLEVAVNHLPDDLEVIPAVIRRAWPGYTETCMLCFVDQPTWTLKPENLYFHP